jgi:hypothetical protein
MSDMAGAVCIAVAHMGCAWGKWYIAIFERGMKRRRGLRSRCRCWSSGGDGRCWSGGDGGGLGKG